MTNPTERPEERDSLAAQIDRLAKFIIEEVPGEPSENQGVVDTAIRLLRTLINEVKLRDATVDAIALALDLSKFASRDDIEDALASKLNEVKELREENARLNGVVDGIAVDVERREQMEEALREIAAGPYNGFEQCKAIARAALSPSDTETRS